MKHTRIRYADGEPRREKDMHSRGKQDSAQSTGKVQCRKKRRNRRKGRGERFVVVKDEKGYTVAYIEALPEGERAELIDGELFVMEAPQLKHQKLLLKLSMDIENYILKKKGDCQVVPAPFAVYMKDKEHNYVEPDIIVVCDPEKLDEKGCHGAPDWIIEIVSPSNSGMDYVRKLALYREAGVREYWIVDPQEEIVTVHNFERNFDCDHSNESVRNSADNPSGESTRNPADVPSGEPIRNFENDISNKSTCNSEKSTAQNSTPLVYPFTEQIKAGIYDDLRLGPLKATI